MLAGTVTFDDVMLIFHFDCSELRAARGKIVDRINTTNSLLFDSDVYEIFDRAEEVVDCL